MADVPPPPQATGPYSGLNDRVFPVGIHLIHIPRTSVPRLSIESHTPRQRYLDSGFYPAHRTSAKFARMVFRLWAMATPGRVLESPPRRMGAPLLARPPQTRACVLLGTEGPDQKATIRYVDRQHRPVSYRKVGITQRARESIQRELNVLSSLPKHCGPALLGSAHEQELAWVETSPVPGKPMSIELPPLHTAAGRTLAQRLLLFAEHCTTGTPLPFGEHPGLKHIRTSQPALDTALKGACHNMTWPVGIQHGDLAPWNVCVTADGSLMAFDWEEALLSGVPLFDVVYFVIQTGYLCNHWSPHQIRAYALALLATAGIEAGRGASVVCLAARDAYLRYADRHADQPGSLQRTRGILGGLQ